MAYTTIDDPSAHFQTTAYPGTAQGAAHVVVNGGNSDLQPDLMWNKRRDGAAPAYVFNSTNGVNSAIQTDNSNDEETASTYFTSFNSDGFTTGVDSALGYSGRTYVAWQWKANGGSRTTNSESGDNPAGGYQANTTAGFSIVDYVGTGADGTKAHGLGVAPKFGIIKSRTSDSRNWFVFHTDYTVDTGYLYLNTTTVGAASGQAFFTAKPNATNLLLGDDADVNTNDENMIAFCWAEVQGYSKFGSYKGNGNADGPFVYTGFKPAWLLYKNTGSVSNWILRDNKRTTSGGGNPDGAVILANEQNAESVNDSATVIDKFSNGFKIKNTENNDNEDGSVYVYAAFAHQPFVTSEGVPCTGR